MIDPTTPAHADDAAYRRWGLGLPASAFDHRIHFALNCGARSCPPIRAYEAASLDAQLRLATESYLAAEVDVDRGHGRVRLPGLMRLYAEDFGGPEEAIAFTAQHLPEPDAAWLAANAARVTVGYRRFDARVAPETRPSQSPWKVYFFRAPAAEQRRVRRSCRPRSARRPR